MLAPFVHVQGNIVAWRKADGDSVAPGDILAEIETDKATIEWEAQEEGFIAKIIKPAGQAQPQQDFHSRTAEQQEASCSRRITTGSQQHVIISSRIAMMCAGHNHRHC